MLAQIWGTPTSHDIDMVDEGDQIVVFSNYRGIINWWMEIFKVSIAFKYIVFIIVFSGMTYMLLNVT